VSGVFSRALKIIFDFEADVTDLSDRLEKAEKTERRLVSEATDLHGEIERLRKQVCDLQSEIDRLGKGDE
jgi:predicted  nucleic acid-binding Zn-ribbon protein